MEFVKVGKNYMIKGSNGRIVSEKEKLQLENNELVLKDITGCECQKETTKKISKNKKRIKEIDREEQILKEWKKELIKKETAQKGESADDIIQETDTTI
jgi:hypothetical protein